MISFRKIDVFLWPDRGWRVQWSLGPSESFILNDHEISIERSSGQNGPWKEIAKVTLDDVIYEDRSRAHRSIWDRISYKLRIINKNDLSVVTESKPQTLGAVPDVSTKEIIRQHDLLLYGVNNHPGYYALDFACFKRTKQGTNCPYCRDDLTGEIFLDRCTECLGTRYLEKFSNSIKFRARFITSPSKNSEITLYGDKEVDTRSIFMSNFPVLEPGDILVEKNSDGHWEVVNINTSEPGGILVSQRATVNRLYHNNIVNKLHYD